MDAFTDDRPFTAAHCQAARRLLGWTAQHLANKCHLGHATIRNFENGHRPNLQMRTQRDILKVFHDAGIVWRTEDPGDPHIKCRDGVVAVLRTPKTSG